MAIRNVVTRGYGAGASIAFVVTRGYSIGVPAPVVELAFSEIAPNESLIYFTSNTSALISPLNGSIQTLDHGSERIAQKLVYRNKTGNDRATMIDFAVGLNGQATTVSLRNYAENNRGSFGGTPLVSGAGQTGTSINIDGCSNSVTNWIREGDWFSIGGELKICTADANSSGGGAATISFAPRLRYAPDNNSAVTTSAATGTFKLESNGANWNNKPNGFSDFTFSFIEEITS